MSKHVSSSDPGLTDPSGAAESEPFRLIQQAKGGDREALGQLLEIYRGYLSVMARMQIGKRLQGKVDAGDLVQEAFLIGFREFDQFRGSNEKEFLGWLRQILVSLVANLIRHYQGAQCRDVRLEQQLANEIDQSSQALGAGLMANQSTPSQQVSQREQEVVLADAMLKLPEEWRELLIFRHLEGLTFPEVAEQMGKTLDVVKKLWPRALLGLRRILEAGNHAPPTGSV